MQIGLDIGGTNIKGVLLSGKKVIARKKISVKTKSNKKQLITQIFDCINFLVGKDGKVSRIGIGVPGPFDFKKQKILNPPNVTGLRNTYLGKIVEEKFTPTPNFGVGVKTILDNDVNCMVLAEAILGAGRGKKLVVGLGLGTGVGGGVVLNKKIHHGANATAGEIGHMIIRQGRKCGCGNDGCLEAYVNEKGIRKTAKQIMGKSIDTISLFEMAKKGNKKAIKIWQITGQYLGIGLANLVNILNPDIIIIGGGIAGAGKFLLKPARKQMKKNILSPLAKNTPVARAKLGEYAGAIGAGLLHS